MGEQTAISWTDATFNMWIGCWKIADECANCYAETTDNQRWGGQHWGRTAPRKWTGDAYWKQLAAWNRKANRDGVRLRVFVGSLMDWAEIHPVPEIRAEMNRRRARFWGIAKQCESLDFLMLTKRPENAAALLPWMASPEDWQSVGVAGELEQIAEPWPNVWPMATAGTVKSLRRVVPLLRSIPAAVRGISCEPMLENIPRDEWDCALDVGGGGGPIHWLIVGNESGQKRRPAGLDWVRTARDAAEAHGVAFHFKQWVTEKGAKIHLPVLDGVQHAGFPNG